MEHKSEHFKIYLFNGCACGMSLTPYLFPNTGMSAMQFPKAKCLRHFKCFNITDMMTQLKKKQVSRTISTTHVFCDLILLELTINLLTHSIPFYLFQFTPPVHLCPACLSLISFHAHFQCLMKRW